MDRYDRRQHKVPYESIRPQVESHIDLRIVAERLKSFREQVELPDGQEIDDGIDWDKEPL